MIGNRRSIATFDRSIPIVLKDVRENDFYTFIANEIMNMKWYFRNVTVGEGWVSCVLTELSMSHVLLKNTQDFTGTIVSNVNDVY